MTGCHRTPSEWFAEAARCYIENHQGCPWCGGPHRVYQIESGSLREYSCNVCDFRAGHDAAANRSFSYLGEDGARNNPDSYPVI